MQRRRWGGGGWQHTRQTLEKSPTSKLYTTWAHILSDRNVFAPGGGETAGSNAPGAFLVDNRSQSLQQKECPSVNIT